MSVVKHVQSGVPLIVDQRFHILTQLKNFYSNTIASLKLKLTTNGKSERCSKANMENQNKTTTTKNRTKQRKRYPCVNAFSIKKMLAKLFEIFVNFRCRPKIVSKSFFSWEENQKNILRTNRTAVIKLFSTWFFYVSKSVLIFSFTCTSKWECCFKSLSTRSRVPKV